jgi:hypothetical protein
MNITTSLLFYLLLGAVVAAADFMAGETAGIGERLYRGLTALLFWPLYLPALLQRPPGERPAATGSDDSACSLAAGVSRADELAAAIRQVETELAMALASLGGWSEAVIAREQHRLDELRAAWHAQAEKIRELERLLKGISSDQSMGHLDIQNASSRAASSYRARSANIDRLRILRDKYRTDLLSTLAWVRELVTMIHLAKYTDAPASRADELVTQIATSIEGISEVVTWREGPPPVADSATSAKSL